MYDKSENSLTVAFAQSMRPEIVIDIGIDYSEISLDQLYDALSSGNGSQLLRDIPIVKTVVTTGKIIYDISSVFRLKKMLTFFQTVREGHPNPEEINRRFRAAKRNEKWFIREVEEIVVYMERQTSAQKSKMQARIYLDYICGKLPYKKYIEYLDILDRLFLGDIPQIIEYYDYECWDERGHGGTAEGMPNDGRGEMVGANIVIQTEGFGMVFELAKCSRLIATGLLLESMRMHPEPAKNQYKLTEQGRYFARMAKSLHVKSISQEYGNVY